MENTYMKAEPHIAPEAAIELAVGSSRNVVVFIESDGIVISIRLIGMTKTAPLSLTELWIDSCMRDNLTFEECLRRGEAACLAAGLRIFHLQHSMQSGVLSINQEYQK